MVRSGGQARGGMVPASPQGEDAFRLRKPNCVFSAPARAIPRGRQLRRTNDMGKHIADAQRHTIEGILKGHVSLKSIARATGKSLKSQNEDVIVIQTNKQ